MSEIVCPVHARAGADPHATALVWHEGELTYDQLDSLVEAAKRRLHEMGCQAGDRIAICSPNTWQYVVLLDAVFRLKAIAVPFSTRFPTSLVNNLVKSLHCKLMVVPVKNDLFPVEEVLFDDLIQSNEQLSVTVTPRVDSDQPATILFSSGSTGLPKAILHSWGNHYYNALGSNDNIELEKGDTWLLSLPLYHVAGVAVLFRCFAAGATVVIPHPDRALAESIQSHSVSHVSMVDTQLLRLLDDAQRSSFEHLKHLLIGGSAVPGMLIRRAFDRGLPVHTTYGMTEMGSQVTTTPAEASLESLCTSGNLLSHREIKIDADGQILVKGRTRFLGYVSSSGLEEPFDDDGWFETGDLGFLDAEERLHVVGRKDNMFISGGENIHPEEIERALEALDGINRAIVVPVPEKVYGARPVAFIDYDGEEWNPKELHGALEGKIARFMLPVAFFGMAEAGEQKGMKISRKVLQKKATDLTEKNREA